MRKAKEHNGTLIIRGIDASLRGRVNAMAELLDLDRDRMVLKWLENETCPLEAVQRELAEANRNSRNRSQAPKRRRTRSPNAARNK